MTQDECFLLGHITRPHGIQGECKLKIDADMPEKYQQLESVFVQKKGQQTLVPFFVEHIVFTSNQVLAKFEEVDSIDEAQALQGGLLYLPLNLLPKLEPGQYYFHDLEGLMVQDDASGTLGKVTGVNTQTMNNLLEVDYKGQTMLIPMTEEVMYKVDLDAQQVLVRLPNGFIDLYITEA